MPLDQYCSTIHVSIKGAGLGVKEIAGSMGLDAESLDNGNIRIEANNNEQVVDILNALKSKGIRYGSVDIRKANLEEVFLELTGESLISRGEDQ